MDIPEWRLTDFTVVREVLLDLTISFALTTFDLVHRTVARWKAHTVWEEI